VIVQAARPGAKGVDCITVLNATSAHRLKAAGIDFVVRYLGTLGAPERDAILGAGLALLAVGYSRSPGWSPNAALGAQDGAAAVLHATQAGLPSGMHLFCDLEGPASTATGSDAITYVNVWAAAVRAAGYRAGLYVGYGVPLSSWELYHRLTVDAYWHSCSQVPDVDFRGYSLIQNAKANQVIAGIQVDVDEVQADKLGDTPMWLAPDPVNEAA
jgi:hypothetical protein